MFLLKTLFIEKYITVNFKGGGGLEVEFNTQRPRLSRAFIVKLLATKTAVEFFTHRNFSYLSKWSYLGLI